MAYGVIALILFIVLLLLLLWSLYGLLRKKIGLSKFFSSFLSLILSGLLLFNFVGFTALFLSETLSAAPVSCPSVQKKAFSQVLDSFSQIQATFSALRVTPSPSPSYPHAIERVGVYDPKDLRSLVDVLEPGDRFTIISYYDTGNGYLKIFTSDGSVGIIKFPDKVYFDDTDVLRFTSPPFSASTRSPSSGSSASSSASAKGTVYVTASSANVRKRASADAAQVATVHSGEKLTVIGQSTASNGRVWYNVRTGSGDVGWISSGVVSFSGSRSQSRTGGSASSQRTDSVNTPSPATGQMVYAATKGKCYHSISNCSGMIHYQKMSIQEAVDRGWRRCPHCW